MGELYSQHKDQDGFLYIAYSGENTFGHWLPVTTLNYTIPPFFKQVWFKNLACRLANAVVSKGPVWANYGFAECGPLSRDLLYNMCIDSLWLAWILTPICASFFTRQIVSYSFERAQIYEWLNTVHVPTFFSENHSTWVKILLIMFILSLLFYSCCNFH